jgi:hypothetical protein
MRVNLNEGQEIIRADFNKLQAAKEREFYDRVFYEILKRTTDGFFQGSCLVTRVNATTCQVAAGLGFQNDTEQSSPEPTKRPIFVAENTNKAIAAAHGSLNRIDIVSIKSARATTLTEERRYKATIESEVTNQEFDVETDWEAEILVTAGTPHANPEVPGTPEGYIKIAELLITAAIGLDSGDDITDTRNLLPIMASSSSTGSPEYDAIVGNPAKPEVGYTSLKDALDVAASGWKILVTEDEEINDIPTVGVDNVEIVFKRGVTFARGTAAKGIHVVGDGCKIVNGRFLDFDTSGDFGIHVEGDYCEIQGTRFKNCDTEIEDDSTRGVSVLGIFTEA